MGPGLVQKHEHCSEDQKPDIIEEVSKTLQELLDKGPKYKPATVAATVQSATVPGMW
jgi:phenylpyruvate tautomerase PptA (4-oxalocrotonate tautomerase family)